MVKQETSDLLLPSLYAGFIDYKHSSDIISRPSLVVNNPPHSKVFHTISQELQKCSYFEFSVAFITSQGISMILQPLYEAKKRGVKGKIITSDYLGFTDPNALRLLIKNFDNIEIRFSMGKSFHAKGYFFYHSHNEYVTMIVGSSNLTSKALAVNVEWNVRLISMAQGELLRTIQNEFNSIWSDSSPVSDSLLYHYEKYRKIYKQSYSPIQEEEVFNTERIVANKMQREALESLELLRQKGENKALIISATGTGKTFLSAFDVKRCAPLKFLYIVHRQQIASESIRKFKQILGESLECSFIGGSESFNRDAPFLFAMIQTFSKESFYNSFAEDEFDYIVIDEVHRAGAPSYKKILSYFKPKFLLGMTATPERSDDINIYSLFDYNVAYEIRLNQALEADLLAPFHYYGISELSVDEIEFDDLSQFSRLEEEELADKIAENIYRYTVPKVRRRGLIFVSKVEQAKLLMKLLNQRGFNTLALSGSDDEKTRNIAFERLERGKGEDALEYLIAVDILNEGIDIPSLNQIIMLRPTQSAIVFVQQLGRGLRKHKGKEFLTVIDFIGNYTNNYLIPIALYGDTSYKKDYLRKLVSSGSLSIYGESTVNFDHIAKERIYKAINDVNFSTIKFLKEEYLNVKRKINQIPTMSDFLHFGLISPLLFIDYSKNFYSFKKRVEKDATYSLQKNHIESLNFFSKVIAPGLRITENFIVRKFVEGVDRLSKRDIIEGIKKEYGYTPTDSEIDHSIVILQNGFFTTSARSTFGNITYCETRGENITPTQLFKTFLTIREYRLEIEDILTLGEYEFRETKLADRVDDNLILYQKYSRQDVCRLLHWDSDQTGTLFGYKIDYKTRTCPIFVTYHKNVEEISPTTNYFDHFISPSEFEWETRTRVKLNSKEPKAIRGESGDIRKLLFIQKNNDEGITFYYLGEVEFISNWESTKPDKHGNELPVVVMRFKMKSPVPSDLYEYITQPILDEEE